MDWLIFQTFKSLANWKKNTHTNQNKFSLLKHKSENVFFGICEKIQKACNWHAKIENEILERFEKLLIIWKIFKQSKFSLRARVCTQAK